jgi:hypothetical protein
MALRIVPLILLICCYVNSFISGCVSVTTSVAAKPLARSEGTLDFRSLGPGLK